MNEAQAKSAEQLRSEELKKRHNAKAVFNITIEGEDKTYSGWIRRPSIKEISGVASIAKNDPIESNSVLLKSCWLEGDKEILEDEELMLAAFGVLDQILHVRVAELKKY